MQCEKKKFFFIHHRLKPNPYHVVKKDFLFRITNKRGWKRKTNPIQIIAQSKGSEKLNKHNKFFKIFFGLLFYGENGKFWLVFHGKLPAD